MKIITINLPMPYLKLIQILNDLGIYPSRSEAIRIALREFLNEELKLQNTLNASEEDIINLLKRGDMN